MKSWEPTATNSSLPTTATSRLSPGASPVIPLISGSVLSQALAREGRSARPPLVTSRKSTNARGSLISLTNQRTFPTGSSLHRQSPGTLPAGSLLSRFTDHGGDCIAVGGHARSATSGRLRRDHRRDRGLDLLVRRGRRSRNADVMHVHSA